jgi:putative two-component system response regulator
VTTILVIDDEPVIRELVAEILADAGYDVVTAADTETGLVRLEEHAIELVVSDIVMPGLSGLDLLAEVGRRRPSLPVVLVTGAGTHARLSDALAGGAAGLVMKPFSHAELQRAVATALERARRAERELGERLLTPTLAGALANAIEARDSTMHGHCERMSALAVRLANELQLDARAVEVVRLGAILHDVGKIGIPDSVLMKSGPLGGEERALMRTHPLLGDRLLEPLELLQSVRPVVRHHHERWDGGGYPDGLAGEEIPLAARVVAIADAVEAMAAKRRYRARLMPAAIVGELERGRGSQWDPELTEMVLRLIDTGELRFEIGGLALDAPGSASVSAPSFSVLLVENDLDDAVAARRALEDAFGRVLVAHAESAARALDLCRGSTWSLVVVDERLADANGLDLLATLRTEVPEVPVLMLTGSRSEELALEAVRRGASDYVVKGEDFSETLCERARALLRAGDSLLAAKEA